MVWLKFALCLAIILVAGWRVARYGDTIAQRTGLGGVWIGVTLIALITSLPELFTGISSVALAAAPDITIGDLFGSNALNLFILALLDLSYRSRPLLATASLSHVSTAGFSLILVSIAAASLLISSRLPLGLGWIGLYTPILFVLYLVMSRMLFLQERGQASSEQGASADPPLSRVYLYFAIAAAFIIGAGIWLAFVGKEIAQVTGLEQGFVGSLFIAVTTSLPEVAVSFSALRLGAIDMAVANMLGSNLFNMTIIGVDDIFYRPGPILAHVSPNHTFIALVVVVMTGFFIAGLLSRTQRKVVLGGSWYTWGLIAAFLGGTYINFNLSVS